MVRKRRSALIEFCQHTSAHGFIHLSHNSSLKRTLWIIFIVLAFSGFCIHFSLLINRYLRYPKINEDSLLFNDFKFPDVTFCRTAPFSKAKLNNSGKMSTIAKLHKLFNMKRVADEILTVRDVPYFFNRAIRKYAYLEDVYFWPQDNVIFCRYDSRSCNFTDFQIYRHPNSFACMTFVPPERGLTLAGPEGGLELVLNVGEGEAFLTNNGWIGYIDGYMVDIHPPGTMPHMTSSRIIAQSHSELNIELNMRRKHRHHTPPDPCVENVDKVKLVVDFCPKLSQEFTYNTKDCRILQSQKKILESCKCLDDGNVVEEHLLEKSHLCHELPEHVFYHHAVNTEEDDIMVSYKNQSHSFMDHLNDTINQANCVLQAHHFYHEENSLMKNCPVPCETTYYDYIVTNPQWPPNNTNVYKVLKQYTHESIEIAKRLNYTLTELNNTKVDQYIHVVIYARSLDSKLSKETLALPIEELFSGIGGILGLWIGVSLVTFCEIIELIIQLTCCCKTFIPKR